MESKVETIGRSFRCESCLKHYSSYKSLWKHRKNFHSNIVINSPNNVENDLHIGINTPSQELNDSEEKLLCKYCDKSFQNVSNRIRHEKKICYPLFLKEEEKNKEIKKELLKLQIIKEKREVMKEKREVIKEERGKIKDETNKIKAETDKIREETKKMQIEMKQKSVANEIINNTNCNNTNTNINNTNNGTINNVFIKYNEISHDCLSKKEVLRILSKQLCALEESVQTIHFGDIPECKNVYITNLQNNVGYGFTGDKFVALTKNELLNDIIETHITELANSIRKYKNKISEETYDRITNLINKINKDNIKYFDYEKNKVFKNFREYKSDALKFFIYNNSDKIEFEKLKKMTNLIEKPDEIDDV
jgi:hypothetical protein